VIPRNEQSPPDTLQEKYTIEKLLDRKKEKNKVLFKVKWKNYSKPTWEPRSILMKDVPELVKEYEKDH